jgi:hypothetical protein
LLPVGKPRGKECRDRQRAFRTDMKVLVLKTMLDQRSIHEIKVGRHGEVVGESSEGGFANGNFGVAEHVDQRRQNGGDTPVEVRTTSGNAFDKQASSLEAHGPLAVLVEASAQQREEPAQIADDDEAPAVGAHRIAQALQCCHAHCCVGIAHAAQHVVLVHAMWRQRRRHQRPICSHYQKRRRRSAAVGPLRREGRSGCMHVRRQQRRQQRRRWQTGRAAATQGRTRQRGVFSAVAMETVRRSGEWEEQFGASHRVRRCKRGERDGGPPAMALARGAPDLYAALGVASGADAATVRQAYLRVMLEVSD